MSPYSVRSAAERDEVALWAAKKLRKSDTVVIRRKVKLFRCPGYDDSMLIGLRRRIERELLCGVDVIPEYRPNSRWLVSVTVRRHQS